MADHIRGPLYYEQPGKTGPVIAFVHPNPMDQSCGIIQMAHLPTWYRTIFIDIPGYGKSPKATDGLTMDDMALACWEALDEALPGEPAILVGCSVGSSLVKYMYHQRLAQVPAIILSGTGCSPNGVDFRWLHAFQDHSAAFRATPMAHYFADLVTERNPLADAATIIRQFKALSQPDPDNLNDLQCPVAVLTGSEDSAHGGGLLPRDVLPDVEVKVLRARATRA